MSTLLILFAKAPIPGQVKTRLTPFLSEHEAAQLQQAFTSDLLEKTESLANQQVIACAPDTQHPFFRASQKKHGLTLIAQEGIDLGARMHAAFVWGFEAGLQKVVIIGCDAPTLPDKFIKEAFDALDTQQLVLGPSLDGGYYLIGATQSVSALFENIPWGTDTVFTETLDIVTQQKIPCHLLPFWYDIDRPTDLRLLNSHLQFSARQPDPDHPKTRTCLSELLEKRQAFP